MDLGKRIMVLGSPGSGKSTIAAQIGEITGLPVVHLDRLTLLPGWRTAPDMDMRITMAANQPEWVIDGNYSKTRDVRLERADTVIYLDFNRFTCMFRIIKRRIQWHGKARPNVADGCPERLNRWFIGWVWNYPKRSHGDTAKWIGQIVPPKQVYHLRGNKAVKRFLIELRKA